MNQPEPTLSSSLDPLAMARLRENRDRVLASMGQAERRARRSPNASRLLAVVKHQPTCVVEALIQAGQRELAENRVQALGERPPDLADRCRLHLIGPLQRNKAAKAVRGFEQFHALDRFPLATLLNRVAGESGKRWPVFLQVNVAMEARKQGCSPAEAAPFAAAVAKLPALEIRGLMTMAPWSESSEASRPVFAALRELSLELQRCGALPDEATELSMGMSGDFAVAIEEGATLVRVGSALFEGVTQEE